MDRIGSRDRGAPGRCGTARRDEATLNGRPLDLGAPVAGGATYVRDMRIPGRTGTVVVRAADEAGNSGAPRSTTVAGGA
ncbi:MAG: hypothetical protein ACXVFK_19310, partial [Solirubrobacteraceae bacterium]